MQEIRLHGRGGQGVVTLAELLAKTAIKVGLEAQTLPFFGVERRGAAVKAAVRLDKTPIKVRSQSYHPGILVLMSENLLDIGLEGGVAENAVIVANADKPLPVKRPLWLVDAERIAIKNELVFGGEPFINVPMLGALCRVLDLPFPVLEETLREQWSGAKAKPNIDAAREAYESVWDAGVPQDAPGRPELGGAAAAMTGGVEGGDISGDKIENKKIEAKNAADKEILQPISRPVIGAGGLTGTWRTQRPVYDPSLCNACQLCWLFCPESAISREDRTIDYTYCKGCGICAAECAKQAIRMEREESR